MVLEVAEADPDPLDALDEVVDGLGRPVGDARQVEVAQLGEPGLDGPGTQPVSLS